MPSNVSVLIGSYLNVNWILATLWHAQLSLMLDAQLSLILDIFLFDLILCEAASWNQSCYTWKQENP